MFLTRTRFVIVLVALVVSTVPISVMRADVIKLKSGGEIRGVVRGDATLKTAKPVVIETLSGSVVEVDSADIRFITKRALVVEEHETRARQTPQNVDAQWALAEWCREHGLTSQRETHLRNILKLEVDHRSARAALGYRKYSGRWMTYHEWQRSRGLVKHKGKYITPEELELLQEHEAALEKERSWYKKVFVWKTWLTGPNASRRQRAAKELAEVTDPNAVSALARYFRNDKNDGVRRIYIEILKRMPGGRPAAALATQSLYDVQPEIRYAALNAISEKQYPAAIPSFVKGLTDDSVQIVRRAGDGLKRVGNKQAIVPLINALVTTHRYEVRVRDTKNTTSFNTNGTTGGQSVLPPHIEAMMRAGQLPNGVIVNNPQQNQMIRTKKVTVNVDHKNREVLAALQKITGQSFGYNKRDWRLWMASTKIGAGVKAP